MKLADESLLTLQAPHEVVDARRAKRASRSLQRQQLIEFLVCQLTRVLRSFLEPGLQGRLGCQVITLRAIQRRSGVTGTVDATQQMFERLIAQIGNCNPQRQGAAADRVIPQTARRLLMKDILDR